MIDMESYILGKFPNKAPTISGEINTLCPFHDDLRPSFSINVFSGFFICRSASCGIKGNFPLFYKLMEGHSSWSEVFEDLKSTDTNFDVRDLFDEKKKIKNEKKISPFPIKPFIEDIGELQFFRDRNLKREIIDAYGLKYGKSGKFSGMYISGSIVAPVWDLYGTYRTFQVRYLNPKSKLRWGNPINSCIQDLLYGGWLISNKTDKLWIVEGASDVWNLFGFGVQVVGINTKEASDAQLLSIKKLCEDLSLIPIVCLDGDVRFSQIKHGNVTFDEKLYYELSALSLNPILAYLDEHEDPGSLSCSRFREVEDQVENSIKRVINE